MRNLLFTDVNRSCENVMVFTRLEPAAVIAALKDKITFVDAYEVRDEDCQFYLYDPLWLTEEQETRIASPA